MQTTTADDRAQLRAQPGDMTRSWRGPQVCSLSGCTYRQLDYWARTGALVPSIADARGSGTQRLYTTADVAAAALLYRLSKLGVRISAVAPVIAAMQQTPLGLWPHWVVVTHEGLLIELTDALTAKSGDLDVCWLLNLRAVVVEIERRGEQLDD